MTKADRFLKEHKIRAADIDIKQLVELFTSEMINGLEGKDSSLRMIPAYIEAENEFITEMQVAAIDAGGTNLRVAEVSFNKQGKLEMSKLVNAKMPGLDGEISKDEFFQTIAGLIKDQVAESRRIGFCFSYPTEILPNKDGRLLQFCKEVQAPEVVGQLIGKNLLETLGMPDKQIVLLNDTVATLLAGKSASFGRSYDSYIGYILGTGTNTCYIENNSNILKNKALDGSKSQIVNIESGNFGITGLSDLDTAFDNTTDNPGNYTFEKMFAGGYFGGLCLSTLKIAANEDVFSSSTVRSILALNQLSAEDVNNFVSKSKSGPGPLSICFKNSMDEKSCMQIIDCLIDRGAKLVAANLAAVVLKTNKGKSAGRPILITVEGTTFYKLHNLKLRFEKYFTEFLSGERKRFVEFAEVEHSSLVGAALAALID